MRHLGRKGGFIFIDITPKLFWDWISFVADHFSVVVLPYHIYSNRKLVFYSFFLIFGQAQWSFLATFHLFLDNFILKQATVCPKCISWRSNQEWPSYGADSVYCTKTFTYIQRLFYSIIQNNCRKMECLRGKRFILKKP